MLYLFIREKSLLCGLVLPGLMLAILAGHVSESKAEANKSATNSPTDVKSLVKRLIVSAEDNDQVATRQNWRQIVGKGAAEDLPLILAAMKDVGPLAENWVRAAADSIAERDLADRGRLPNKDLEAFTRDAAQPARGRRVAYEWLVKVDETAPARLLPTMLDDASLELRYDAVALLLSEAKQAAGESEKLRKYQRALQSARDKSQLAECAKALSELGQAPNMAQQMGFLTKWKVIGPFDNSDRAGFDRVLPPETEIDLSAEYAGKNGIVKWKSASSEQEELDALGTVDLNKALVEEKDVLAYAFATFVVNEDAEAECRYESKEATKLWVNGDEVAVNNVYHSGGGLDQYIAPCKLKQGVNQILIKVCQNEQTEPWTRPWDFRLRITDQLGGAISEAK